jgi:hypothetical protein
MYPNGAPLSQLHHKKVHFRVADLPICSNTLFSTDNPANHERGLTDIPHEVTCSRCWEMMDDMTANGISPDQMPAEEREEWEQVEVHVTSFYPEKSYKKENMDYKEREKLLAMKGAKDREDMYQRKLEKQRRGERPKPSEWRKLREEFLRRHGL